MSAEGLVPVQACLFTEIHRYKRPENKSAQMFTAQNEFPINLRRQLAKPIFCEANFTTVMQQLLEPGIGF